MDFFEFYVWISLFGLALITTTSLRDIYNSTFSQYGIILTWIILIISVFLPINKLNLLWLVPIAFVLPYSVNNLLEKYNIKYTLRYSLIITIFSLALVLMII